mmetsp:Transcript_3011/g.7235  ORF Transcript_3011/g.7235 Transcript_3011/m.7235 type:complete len:81 (-) Transcript_3011:1099-1341(-)
MFIAMNREIFWTFSVPNVEFFAECRADTQSRTKIFNWQKFRITFCTLHSSKFEHREHSKAKLSATFAGSFHRTMFGAFLG